MNDTLLHDIQLFTANELLTEFFGSWYLARQWLLDESNPALGGESALRMIRLGRGQEVLDIINYSIEGDYDDEQ